MVDCTKVYVCVRFKHTNNQDPFEGKITQHNPRISQLETLKAAMVKWFDDEIRYLTGELKLDG